jgi:BirA family biotin operon repressor/biotin-[acetyl-CoA-carboxylase] ligase
LETLQHCLQTKVFGRVARFYDDVPSTLDRAAAMASDGAPHGAMVLARTQSAGRGRMGRAWASPPGGLWLSLVLRPTDEEGCAPGVTLLMATAVAEAVAEHCAVEAMVRWPNDVYVGDLKIAGLLAEARWTPPSPPLLLLGVGVNANVEELPPEVSARAASLHALTGRAVAADALLAAMLLKMEQAWEDFDDCGLMPQHERMRKRCATLGREVQARTADGEVRGRAVDLSTRGSLIIDDGSARTELWSCEEIILISC